MAKTAQPPEIKVQAQIIDAIRWQVSPVDVRAVPNAAKRSMWEAARAKREGMVAGTPDLHVSWPGGCGWIEVKRPGYTASAVSEAQADLIAKWTGWGLNAAIAASADEAIGLLRSWGAPVRSQERVDFAVMAAEPYSVADAFAGLE